MKQITYKPSYLEELVFFEVMIENWFDRTIRITTPEERAQFFETVYWGAAAEFLSRCRKADEEKVKDFFVEETMKSRKLCELLGLDNDSRGIEDPYEELFKWLHLVERYTFELYARIRVDIMACEDAREWVCQLRTLLAYITKPGTEDSFSKSFLRFLRFIQKIDSDDVVFNALCDLQERRLNVKVVLSGEDAGRRQ